MAFGVRAGWAQGTEYTLTYAVTHGEWKLRAVVEAEKTLGRGALGLRIGAGPTAVHEVRVRDQAARIADGASLNTSAWSVLPAAEAEFTTSLRVYDDFGLVLSMGPSLTWLNSGSHFGWISTLGIAWLP